MTPDELRRRLNGTTPQFREALAECLVLAVDAYAAVDYNGVECNPCSDVTGFDFVLTLACLTDAQRADAWHAACDRVATESEADELTGTAIPGIPTTPISEYFSFYDEHGNLLPPDVGFVETDEQAAHMAAWHAELVTKTFDDGVHQRTIYGFKTTDGTVVWPGLPGGTANTPLDPDSATRYNSNAAE